MPTRPSLCPSTPHVSSYFLEHRASASTFLFTHISTSNTLLVLAPISVCSDDSATSTHWLIQYPHLSLHNCYNQQYFDGHLCCIMDPPHFEISPRVEGIMFQCGPDSSSHDVNDAGCNTTKESNPSCRYLLSVGILSPKRLHVEVS